MKKVAIVVPAYYRPHLKHSELTSLKHLNTYLGGYDKYFVTPDNVKKSEIKQEGFNLVRFPKEFFANTKAYNKLMLSEQFYKAFTDYEFILIYQLDALVFSDQLIYWCRQGYDNISAPWFYSRIGFFTHKNGSPISGGNGGLSLRNVQSCLSVLKRVNQVATRTTDHDLVRMMWLFLAILTGQSNNVWLRARAEEYPFNEDGFWSLEAPKYLSRFKVAPFRIALKFSFETYPRICFWFNKYKLPFGCHAWEKYDKKFWLPYVLK